MSRSLLEFEIGQGSKRISFDNATHLTGVHLPHSPQSLELGALQSLMTRKRLRQQPRRPRLLFKRQTPQLQLPKSMI